MKRKSLISLLVLLASVMLSLTGCHKYEQINITSGQLQSLNMDGMRAMQIDLLVGVDNPAGKVVVKTAEGTIKQFGKVIGKVSLAPLTLKARTVAEYPVQAHVELSSGLGFLELLKLADPKHWNDLYIDLSFSGTASGVKVKRNINDVPLKKLLEKKINEKV